MNKKIGTFLMFMLVLCAVLLLMATAARAPQSAAPETTMGTTVPAETKTPEPSGTQPPQETVPEAAPLAAPPEGTPDAASRVARILEGSSMEQTAVTRRAEDPQLNRLEGTEGAGNRSMAHALAELAQDRKMNPIAAFWLLVSDGAYEKEKLSAPFAVSAFETPRRETKQYAYSDEGARQLVTDLLNAAAGISDDLGLELAVLGANLSLEPDQVNYSKKDGCRYVYVSAASDRSTHILCFYLRGDQKGEWIDDVEFQLLNMRHAAGDAEVLEKINRNCDRQTAVLMAAAELLMTGEAKASGGKIAASYEVGARKAEVERFGFTAEGEWGTLTNYRLR